jgi:hypothetical protein
MPATIIYGDKTTLVNSALIEGDNLWLSSADLTRATGWELKPKGPCLSDRCVSGTICYPCIGSLKTPLPAISRWHGRCRLLVGRRPSTD